MQILKRYVDETEWRETTLEECIEHTEGNGYWKQGTVLEMLKDNQTVFTPFAEYKII